MIRLKVKEVAEQKSISQARLSRLSDIDIKAIRRMYRTPESANIRLETLNKLAYALKVDARDLLEYVRDAFLPGVEDSDSPEQPS